MTAQFSYTVFKQTTCLLSRHLSGHSPNWRIYHEDHC